MEKFYFLIPVSGFSTIFHNFARKAGTFVGAGAGGTIISTIGILTVLKCLKDYFSAIASYHIKIYAATEWVGSPPNFAFLCVLTLISENNTL